MFVGDDVSLAEQLLAEPDAHRRVAGFQQSHLRAPDGDAALRLATLHRLEELRLLAPCIDRARRNVEPCRYLSVRTLQRAQLFQLDQVDRNFLPA